MNALFVGLGGAVGAVGRYSLSLLPCRSAFPLLTLLTNLIGAVLIGFVAGLAGRERLSSGWTLFWKTGVCGGFTTFSTFSLESVTLLQRGRAGLANLSWKICQDWAFLNARIKRSWKAREKTGKD